MTQERDDYMRRQDAEHDMIAMRRPIASAPPRGCVCPVGAEQTCKGYMCPRQPIGLPR